MCNRTSTLAVAVFQLIGMQLEMVRDTVWKVKAEQSS